MECHSGDVVGAVAAIVVVVFTLHNTKNDTDFRYCAFRTLGMWCWRFSDIKNISLLTVKAL